MELSPHADDELYALGLPRRSTAFGSWPSGRWWALAKPHRHQHRAAAAQTGMRALRERWRHLRSLAYWALRPHRLPPALLLRGREPLLRELSQLARCS